ncbi:MAG: hypothetical protein H0X25_07995 [Acidobacteriales bacterium]|nr:hypothetical protein [Terriglobales bacterium]
MGKHFGVTRSAVVVMACMWTLLAFGAEQPVAKLTASDGIVGFESFGDAVALDGNTIVVGDETASTGQCQGPCQQGAAYVFVKPAGGWHNMTQTAKLTPSDGQSLDTFGASVAIRGDTIAVGAPCHPHSAGRCRGAVYLFVKPASGWADMTETAQLLASDDHDSVGFDLGWSVAINDTGDTVFGDALGWPGQSCSAGNIYVFVKPAGGWTSTTQTAELTASDSQCNNVLGATISASGDTLVAGAFGWPGGVSQGASYVFVKPATGWSTATETAELTVSDGLPGDDFGYSVSLAGNTLAAGAPTVTVGGNSQQGAEYILLKPASGWVNSSSFAARITAATGQARDTFGGASALSGSRLAVGAAGASGLMGAAYEYTKPLSGWQTTSRYNLKLTDPAAQRPAFFGGTLALQGNVLVVGADLEKPNGAAYVYGGK